MKDKAGYNTLRILIKISEERKMIFNGEYTEIGNCVSPDHLFMLF